VSEGRQVAESLLRVMEAVGTALDLREVLYRLVEITVASTDADRAVVLLLEDGALVPTAVAGRRVNRDLFRRFKAMPGVRVDEVAERQRMVWGDELVVIEDARSSPAVPDGWVDAFGTTSLAIAPLRSEDGLAGILAVDHTDAHQYTEAELAMLRATSHAARIAIANTALRARLQRADDVRDRLLAASASLRADADVEEVLRTFTDVVHHVFPDRVAVLSTTPADAGDDLVHRTVFPIHAGRGHLGYLTLEGGGRLTSADLGLLERVVAHAGVALERAQLVGALRDQLARTQVLSRLTEVVMGAAAVGPALRRLNEELCLDVGFACVDVAFRERRDAEGIGGRRTDDHEAALVARFGAGLPTGPVPVDTEGTLAVAVPVNGNVAGLLQIRPSRAAAPLSDDDVAVATAIASAIGAAVSRARLQRGLRDANRRLERSDAMGDVADQLDRRLGRTLRQVDETLRDLAADDPGAPDARGRVRRIQDLVASSRLELHRAARSRGHVDLRNDGLESTLHDVVVGFSSTSGVATNFRVEGERAPLSVEVEDALHDVTFDALAFVADAGRATTVTVTLVYGDPLVLVVRDDGVGLAQRSSSDAASGVHHGIGAIRDRVAAVGGRLAIESARPRGVRLAAEVPLAAPVAVRGASPGVVVPLRER
jgi:GAF domain-containing protein